MSTIPLGWFEHADTDGDGKVSGGEAVAFFSRAGLPQASLATLWQLVDNPPRGFLEKSQFDVAVQLIYVAQQGGEMNEMQANAIANGYASYPAPNMQGLSGAPAAPQQPQTMPGAGQISGMQTNDQNQHFQQQPLQPQPTQPQPQANGFGNFGGSFGESFGDFGAQNAPAAAGDEPWPPMSHADVERYAQVFRHHDTDGDGKLSGGEVVPMMMALNAPQEVLKDIWALADADGDGALTKQEFTVAIYLTERARDGRKPPQSLPPGPFPPMAQQQVQPQMQPQMQPAAPVPAPAPVVRDASGALDEDLFSGGPDPSPSGMGEAFVFGGAGGGAAAGANAAGFAAAPAAPVMVPPAAQPAAPPTVSEPPTMPAMPTMPTMPTMPAAPETRVPGSTEAEYAFRGPESSEAGAGAEADRVRAARADAEAADRQLWEQEQAVSQAKATSASLTQQLQDLVMFQRRCEANMEEAAFVARGAREEVEALRKRVATATASTEQARGALDASTSVSASAAQEKAQLEARLREIETAGPALATGSVPEAAVPAELLALRARVADAEQTFAATPSWADWARVQDDGIDVVNLSWGGWAGDSTSQAASPAPPQQAPVT
jgi:hypothetical protein